MDTITGYILTAFALVFVIEGLIYTLFPDQVRKMMAMALNMPPESLRNFCLTMVATGTILVWIIQKF